MVDVDESSDNPLVDQQSDLRNNYFQDANPLENMGVPDPESGNTGFMTGITAFEAGWTIAQGVDQNDLGLIISGVAAAALDVVSAAVDPIAYVAGQLFSWMLEHVEPARAALHALTGNPDMVKAYAATWTNIEKEMLAVGDEFEQSLSQVQGWTGAAGDGYRDRAAAVAGIAKGAAGGAHGIAGITMSMAEVVGGIRVAVRDLLATLAGALVSWAIELACTVGAAAPVVVAQATTKIAQVVRIVASMMKALGKALASGLTWLVQLRDLFDGFWRALNALKQSQATAPA
jgi:hypothetical protein